MAAPKTAPETTKITETTEPQQKHMLQRVLDNPWLLLVLGLLVPTVSYTVWGWIELLFITPAQLP